MILEFSSQEILIGLILLLSFLAIVIKFLQKRISTLRKGFSNSAIVSIPYVDNHILHVMPYNYRSRLIGLGMMCSVFFALLAMNWTVDEYALKEPLQAMSQEPEMIAIVDLVTPPQPPSPIPLPPIDDKIEPIDDYLIRADNEELFEPLEDADEVFDDFDPSYEEIIYKAPIPPPMPENTSKDFPEIFKIVEEMPLFGGCNNKVCSDETLISFIYKNVKYPYMALEREIQGQVTAEFIVETNGSVSGISNVKGIAGGCDQEVLRVIRQMNAAEPKWTAGRQRGKPVRVLYRLPVTFSLS